MRRTVIGVMGAGDKASAQAVVWARELGELIAAEGWVLLTGGRRSGVMDAASRGARKRDGLVIGVLPGSDAGDVSEALDVAVVTAMGSARNNINVLSSDVVVACGETTPGTFSEVALALKAGKPVVLLNDDPETCGFLARVGGYHVEVATSPQDVIELARRHVNR
jgi:uncharacterized protein (TIGR00725 family)